MTSFPSCVTATTLAGLLPQTRKRRCSPRACTSRSRGLYTAVVIALNTGMRETEIRTLRWRQVDFESRTIVVGNSKTAAGTGRHIPMNDRLTLALRAWANKFPNHLTDHYVFAAEQYGRPGEQKPGTYDVDPTHAIGSWKTAVEERTEGGSGNLPVPRPPPQCRYAAARGRRVLPDCGEPSGLESEHHDEDGEALRAHRKRRASRRGRRARSEHK